MENITCLVCDKSFYSRYNLLRHKRKIHPEMLTVSPGAHLGAPEAHLGAPGAHLGAPRAHLGAPGTHLGAYLGAQGAHLGAQGAHFGAPPPPPSEESIVFQHPFTMMISGPTESQKMSSSLDPYNDMDTSKGRSGDNRRINGQDQEFPLTDPQHLAQEAQDIRTAGQREGGLQIADRSESRSDLVAEEYSPYGSLEFPKTEALIPSGARTEKPINRFAPLTQLHSGEEIGRSDQSTAERYAAAQKKVQQSPVKKESAENFGKAQCLVPSCSRHRAEVCERSRSTLGIDNT